GVKGSPVIWSNANLKDALPGVLSPAGWSLVQAVLRYGLFRPQMEAGYAVPAGMEVVRRFDGRAYFDLTTMAWVFYDALAVRPAELNRSMGGHQPEIAVPPGNPLKGAAGRRRGLNRMRLLRAVRR